jgi:hypothetical protein
MKSHPHVLPPAASRRSLDLTYIPPPKLTEAQEKTLAECTQFLSKEKVPVVEANLRRAIKGLFLFTPEEVEKTRAVAKRHGLEIT